jgi:pyrimidine deaminase RibD-like protein
MRATEFESVDINKLDDCLAKLCAMIKKGKETRPEYYGAVAAGILTPKGKWVAKINYPRGSKRVHAERAAIEEYQQYHGDIPKGSIMITTCSPCNEQDDSTAEERVGDSCTDLINQQGFDKVYSGYKDPTQDNQHGEYKEVFTKNKQLHNMCKQFASTFLDNVSETQSLEERRKKNKVRQAGYGPGLYGGYGYYSDYGNSDSGGDGGGGESIEQENFADGKNPQDKGDSKRHGINTKASVSSLRKTAKQGGRKGQLAHWLANMKSGRAKK